MSTFFINFLLQSTSNAGQQFSWFTINQFISNPRREQVLQSRFQLYSHWYFRINLSQKQVIPCPNLSFIRIGIFRIIYPRNKFYNAPTLVLFTLVFSNQFIPKRGSIHTGIFQMNLSQEQVLQRDSPQFYSHQYFPINLYNPETNSTIPTLVLFTLIFSDQFITETNSTIPTLVLFTLVLSDNLSQEQILHSRPQFYSH